MKALLRSCFAVFALVSGSSGGARAQVVYLGNELRINATVAGSQIAPRTAWNAASGRVLFVWQSFDQDGSGAGVYGRLLGPDGTFLSPERLLAAATAGNQIAPAATATPGGFLATWASESADGSGFGIVLRRFSHELLAESGEVLVPQTTAGNQIQPALASGGNQAVLVWTGPDPSNPAETDVYARRLALDGTPLGNEFRVPAESAGNQSQPTVAVAADGSFLVAWTTDSGDGSGFGVYARKFDAAGNATTGDILVPSLVLFDQVAPAAAGLMPEGFVVAWSSSLQPTSSTVGPQPVVFAQRFNRDGNKIGPPLQVTAQTIDRQEVPAIAAQTGGEFLVAWEATILASLDRQVRGRRYRGDGAPLSGEFPLNTTSPSEQAAPCLSDLGGGRFLAGWQSFGQDGSSWGIYGQRFGTPIVPCTPGPTTLCLAGGRFQVRAQWTTPQGQSGTGQARALTADTGYFWFFDEANVEIVLKVLDACGFSGNFWVFATGLTDVHALIEVLDTVTGESRVYVNPLGVQFQPIQDTGHLFVCSAVATPPASAQSQRIPAPPPETFSAAAVGPCVADGRTLCLRNGRFEVRADWATPNGSQGQGQAVALTSDTGYFWFFDAANVEVVLKILDGCGLTQNYWVFAGGLTDVYVRLTVRDTLTGFVWTRENPLRTPFQPIQDVRALPVCP